MIQSLSSIADLVVALASSKSSLGTCKTTMKKNHPSMCEKYKKHIFFKENTSYSLTVVVDVEAASKFLISYQFHQASTEKHWTKSSASLHGSSMRPWPHSSQALSDENEKVGHSRLINQAGPQWKMVSYFL